MVAHSGKHGEGSSVDAGLRGSRCHVARILLHLLPPPPFLSLLRSLFLRRICHRLGQRQQPCFLRLLRRLALLGRILRLFRLLFFRGSGLLLEDELNTDSSM